MIPDSFHVGMSWTIYLWIFLWACIFGVIPPILVGWFSYRMGTKGRKDAMKLRDEALEQVSNMRDFIRNEMTIQLQTVRSRVSHDTGLLRKSIIAEMDESLDILKESIPAEIQKAGISVNIPEISISSEMIEDMKTSIVKAIYGSYGNLIKGALSAADGQMKGIAGEMGEELTPEQQQELIAKRVQSSIQGYFIRWLDEKAKGLSNR